MTGLAMVAPRLTQAVPSPTVPPMYERSQRRWRSTVSPCGDLRRRAARPGMRGVVARSRRRGCGPCLCRPLGGSGIGLPQGHGPVQRRRDGARGEGSDQGARAARDAARGDARDRARGATSLSEHAVGSGRRGGADRRARRVLRGVGARGPGARFRGLVGGQRRDGRTVGLRARIDSHSRAAASRPPRPVRAVSRTASGSPRRSPASRQS